MRKSKDLRGLDISTLQSKGDTMTKKKAVKDLDVITHSILSFKNRSIRW